MSSLITQFIPAQLIKIGWNCRPLDMEDFEQCCLEEGIWLYKRSLRHDAGLFFYFFERPVIVLNKRVPAPNMLWAAFHELVHYYLHPPELQYFTLGTEDKVDFEANIISSVALIPKYHVETKSFAELREEYGWPDELLWIRKEAYERYAI